MWFFFSRHNFDPLFFTQKGSNLSKQIFQEKRQLGIGFVNLRLWMLLMAGGDVVDNFASFLRRGSAKLGHILLSLIGSGAFWEVKYWKRTGTGLCQMSSLSEYMFRISHQIPAHIRGMPHVCTHVKKCTFNAFFLCPLQFVILALGTACHRS